MADSEKQDKQKAHRKERRLVREVLGRDPEEEVLPHRRDAGDPWTWAKDGKQWYGDEDPKLRRK